MSYEIIRHKRGATFRTIRPLGFDLTDWTITGQVRSGNTVTDIGIRPLPPLGAGLVEVEVPATTTKDWPLGLLRFDLRAEQAGEVVYTATVLILCEEEITQ
jgi:hypothetical protein